MASARAVFLTLLSLLVLTTFVLTSDVDAAARDLETRYAPCGAPASSCSSCGEGYVPCGSATCYNPSIGEVCCRNLFVCPINNTCSDQPGTSCSPVGSPVGLAPSNGYPDATSTITTTGTITLTSTLYGQAPGMSYGAGPAPSPPVVDTSIELPNLPNTSYAPTFVSTPIPNNTSIPATGASSNASTPLVSSTPARASLPSTTTTEVTASASEYTSTLSTSSSATSSPTGAASRARADVGIWKPAGFAGLILAAIMHGV